MSSASYRTPPNVTSPNLTSEQWGDRRRRILKVVTAALLLACLCGCIELDYYLHAATGHLQIINKRQPISELLKEKSTPAQLQKKLNQVNEIRDFASQALLLPENDSYRSYVKLDRPYVVWNVVATPELSLEPLEWCFPVIGCVSYRGYFDQQKAKEFARSIEDDGNDTLITGVPAYSTLNWFADPVLSTFSDWPTTSIAQLIFHELAHQKLYVPDDTVFNESFATAVAQIGLERWLEQVDNPDMTAGYEQQRTRQEQIHQLLHKTRSQLTELYRDDLPVNEKRQQKLDIFAELRGNYQRLRSSWNGFSGYDPWFEELNNARFAFLNNYHRWVPAFQLIMQQEQQDLEKFYWRCRVIAELPDQQRQKLLDRLAETFKQPKESG